LYAVLQGETVLEHVAVGAPVRESLLAPLGEDAFEDRIGTELHTAEDLDAWGREIFVTRQGPELWKPLLVTALVLLLVESWVAAGGASAGARTRSPQGEPEEGRREIGVTAS
jgi:hypothetical protein